MSSDTISEGTLVRILRYDKRPEFNDKEAEIGNYSEKDGTYECWLTDEEHEGSFALCRREEFELVEKEAKKDEGDSTADGFGVGDRVRGKDSGDLGTVVSVDPDGDPKVKLDGESEAQQRFGSEFEVVEKAVYWIGDRVRGKESGNLGTVTAVDADGDPKVRMDGEAEALQRFGKEFEIVEKAGFGVGDRVRGKESGKMGTVVAVDADGDPKVRIDGEEQGQQRFGKEFEIIEKLSLPDGSSGAIEKRGEDGSVSDTDSSSDDKKKKKKKKRKASSSSRSNSSDRHRKRGSAFGRSHMEKMEDAKRRARKSSKGGAAAALNLFGL